ncbi:exosortase/archaeosortase family protein [Candidatus Bathyarchaeota archaeon]|nr:exosortase/archaeosortase family protein [Candidatus Bathyarchaeota archaeon]
MGNDQALARRSAILLKILPLLAFVSPLAILYSLYPASFEQTWVGRTYELFFIWLCFLELVMNWEELREKINTLWSLRTFAFIIFLLIPTVYIVAANFWGVNTVLVDYALSHGIEEAWAKQVPLSTEYLVFMGLLLLIVFLEYGVKGIKNYSISAFFLGIIGTLYTVNNLSPFFTPFQLIVPFTTTLAANVLNFMGYQTSVSAYPGKDAVPVLRASNSQGWAAFGIAWPCAGIESLLIYTVVILLFLSKSLIPWWQKLIYFAVGAVITYFINILRIVTIFVIAIDTGWRPGYMPPEVQRFHDYYGMLYSVTWIVCYPLLIIGSRALWRWIKEKKEKPKQHLQVSQDAEQTRVP